MIFYFVKRTSAEKSTWKMTLFLNMPKKFRTLSSKRYYRLKRNLNREIRQGRKYSKFRPTSALFQIHMLTTQDLWRQISSRKSVTVKLAHGSWVSQLRSVPSRNDVSSRDCGSPFTALQEIGRMNAEQAFHILHFVYEV